MEKISFTDEVAYFTRVAHFRYAISRLMRNHLLINNINPSDGEINPYCGRLKQNLTNTIAVEFLNDIIPYCIFTPLGVLEINPYESKESLELTACFLSEAQKGAFMKDFKQQFGASILQAYDASDYGNGVQPVIYQLNKLPFEKEIQCQQNLDLPVYNALPTEQIAIEQAHWEKIRYEADINLRTSGRKAMTFVNAELTKRKSLNVHNLPSRTMDNVIKQI